MQRSFQGRILVVAVLSIFGASANSSLAQQAARSTELIRLDARLAEITRLVRVNPTDARALSLIDAVAPQVSAIVDKDIEGGTTISEPWVGDDGPIWFMRQAFERSGRTADEAVWRNRWLLASAKMATIVGDYIGTAWFYIALLDAKYRDPGIYRRALDLVARKSEVTCDDGLPVTACELQAGGKVLRALAVAPGGLELERDAIEIIEASPTVPTPAKLRALTTLALAEWNAGTAVNAEALVARIDALLARSDSKLPPGDLISLMVLKARMADAQLDDARAVSEIESAIALISDPATPIAADSEPGAALILDFVQSALTRVCQDCAANYTMLLPSLFTAIRNGESNVSQIARAYLLVGEDRRFLSGTLRAPLYASLRDAQFKASGKFLDKTIRGRVGSRLNEQQVRALDAILSAFWAVGADVRVVDQLIDFFTATDINVARRLVSASLAQHLEEMLGQFGGEVDVLLACADIAAWLHAAGFAVSAEVTLDHMWSKLQVQLRSAPGRSSLSGDLAFLASALVQDAGYKMRRRDIATTTQRLDLAARMARQRLTREWRAGSQRAVAAIRNLLPTLQTLAAIRLKVAEFLPPAARERARAALFEDFQLALLHDTATTLQRSIRQRISSDADLAKSLAELETSTSAIADLSVITRIKYFRMQGAEAALSVAQKISTTAASQIQRSLGASFGDAGIEPVALATLRTRLTTGEGTLLVLEGVSSQLLMLVTKTRTRAWSVSLTRSALERAVSEIRAGVNLADGTFPLFPTRTATELYDKLLRPAEDEIKNLRSITVVASGAMQSLPLGLLVEGVPSGRQSNASANIAWLARRMAISQTPSIAGFIHAEPTRIQGTPSRPFMGIGNPVLADQGLSRRRASFRAALRNGRVADVRYLKALTSLPETATELRSLARLLGADDNDLLLGADATEAAVKDRDLTAYRIISFATHGLVAGNMVTGGEPGLVLTPPSSGTPHDDGLLTMSEVMRLRLNADLVILSACDTATSDGRPRADGLSGLTRAFLSAGARSLLVTHWEIPSAQTVEIMVAMMTEKQSRADLSWAEALRVAQVRMIDSKSPENAHPASWAAFQIVGSSGVR